MGVHADVEHYLCEQCDPRPVDRVSSLCQRPALNGGDLPVLGRPVSSDKSLPSLGRFLTLSIEGDNSARPFLSERTENNILRT